MAQKEDKKEKPQELRYQCLACYKTHKSEDAALKCCDSTIQVWTTNYRRWGKQGILGR